MALSKETEVILMNDAVLIMTQQTHHCMILQHFINKY